MEQQITQVTLLLSPNEFQSLLISGVTQCLETLQAKSTGTNLIESPIDSVGASQHLGFEEATIRRMAAAGEIPGFKKGKRWFFYKSALNEWVRNGRTDNTLEEAEASFIAANKKRSSL